VPRGGLRLERPEGHGPDGYYRADYMGSTFTGSLQPAGNDPSKLTLVYTDEKKNIAIAHSFAENKAGGIPHDKGIMMMCSEQNQTQFRSFAADRPGGAVVLPEN